MTKIRLLANGYNTESAIAKGVKFPVTVEGKPYITPSGILAGYDVSPASLKKVGFDFSMFDAGKLCAEYFSIAKRECEVAR